MEPHERLVIVSNHESLLDGVLLGAFLPVVPVPVLHSEIMKHWFVRLPMQLFDHLVVDTAHPLAMKAVINMVEAGRPVLIFPEGRVTVTGSMMKVYEGPAFVAAKTGARVIPVHIDGAVYSIFSRMRGDFPKKLFPRITVTIHPPERIETPDVAKSKLRRRLETDRLRKILQQTAFASRRPTTLFPALLDTIGTFGRGRRILEDTRQEQTYGRLLTASLALGRIVAKLTREGEFTGVLLPNVSTTVALLMGMFATRRVPAMLNYTAGPENLQHACRLANLRTVITSRAFIEKARLEAVAERLEKVSQVVYLEDLRKRFSLADKLWLMGWARWFPRRTMAAARPEEPAVIVFTSGSEGRPKGVAISHDAILANLAQAHAVIEFKPSDKFMSTLPLFHMFGLTIGVFLPLLAGSRIYLYTSPLHYRVIPELIYDRDCTVLFASSTFLGNYAKYANPFDFQSLRIVVAGAERLAPEVRKVWADKFGLRILEGYGVTETAPVLSVNTPMASKEGTTGEIFPGIDYRIEPVPGIEDAGVLHVRGPNVMLGYLKEDEPGAIEPVHSIYGEGWYSTGDVASVDEAGFITIRGRVKRFAKVAGEMVSLELVERIAAAASPDFEHASAAVTEPGRGETIVLFTEDTHLRRERLQQAARDIGAPELAIPRRVIHVTEIPVLGSGKKDYVVLNRMAREASGAPVPALPELRGRA